MAGSSTAAIQTALNGLNPGDVLEFQNDIYALANQLSIQRSGTQASPIYIRGASRRGVVISRSNGRLIQFLAANHIVIENMTLRGSGVDSGTAASAEAFQAWDGASQSYITIRNVIATGVDKGVYCTHGVTGFLVYDNTFVGNNTWTPSFLNANIGWNDDGINVGGTENCVFNNTLTGFGDSLACSAHSGGSPASANISIHFYRNEIRNSVDDFFEADHARRNVTFYDNRCHNSMTALSLDPLYGGPLVYARNIAINVGRPPFKWNSRNSGQFLYNNTVVRTTGKQWVDIPRSGAEAGWYQPNNGAQRAYGYRNNILVYRGLSSQLIRLDNSGHSPIDFDHNSWYPNNTIDWPGSPGPQSLAGNYANLPATTPVFSGFTKRHEQDNITGSNPWTETVTLGADYLVEVTAKHTLALSADGSAKNSGAIIPNTTDNFVGGLPDRGAVIEGRRPVVYGDRSA